MAEAAKIFLPVLAYAIGVSFFMGIAILAASIACDLVGCPF